MPETITKTDGYGVAQIHGCAMFDKLCNLKIASKISKQTTIMDLAVDESKREKKAALARTYAQQKTAKFALSPDHWARLTPRNLAKAFNSALPNGVLQAKSVPRKAVLAPNPPDPATSLAVHYLPIAYLKTRGLPDPEESASYGTLGMIEAIQSYDPLNGSLEAFLRLRTRGEALDWRRRMDDHDQETRHEIKQMEKARDQLSQRLHREPTDNELMDALMWTAGKFNEVFEASLLEIVSVDSPLADSDGQDISLHDILKKPNQRDPAEHAARRDAVRVFAESAARLDIQHRKVLVMLYGEGLSGKEIAKALGVSKGRVSMVKTKALTILRDALIELRETAGI